MSTKPIEAAGACHTEFDRLRSALDHIAKSARASRSQTRRIRWIAHRAEGALAGQPYIEAEVNLPKSAEGTAEKLQAKLGHERRINRHLRGLLLWVLWHHQGGSSEIGQPIRRAMGIGQFDHLTPEQIEIAKAAPTNTPAWVAPMAEEGAHA